MVVNIIQFLKQVPPVAWIGLLFVLIRSARYARARVGRANRLWIVPAIISAFSLFAMLSSAVRIGNAPVLVLAWVVAAALGGAVGWLTLRDARIGADHHTGRITIPADWSFPPLLLLFFGLRFYVGWRLAVEPDAAGHLDFALVQVAVSGLIAGIFAGKAYALWQKWRGSAREMALPAPGVAL